MSASPLIVRGENSQVITDLPSKLFLDLPARGTVVAEIVAVVAELVAGLR